MILQQNKEDAEKDVGAEGEPSGEKQVESHKKKCNYGIIYWVPF